MKILSKLQQEVANFALQAKALLASTDRSVLNDVSFSSQFANPEYAEKILKDGDPKTGDPDWHLSGAETKDEYAKWVTTVCGMACTVMALDFFDKGEHKTVELAKDSMKYGVYQECDGELSGMRYKEYTQWIKNHDVNAEIYSRLSLTGIRYLLSQGKLLIVSVNPNIRNYKTARDTQKGGHLVLVVGYDKSEDTITIHNPSGFVSQNSHKNHVLSVKEFTRYYAGRGLALSKR